MVFQDTAAALNPAQTVGAQLTEPMRLHLGHTPAATWARGTELLAEPGRPRPLCDTVPPPAQPAGAGHDILCHIPVPVLEAVPHWLAKAEIVP